MYQAVVYFTYRQYLLIGLIESAILFLFLFHLLLAFAFLFFLSFFVFRDSHFVVGTRFVFALFFCFEERQFVGVDSSLVG